MALLRVAYNLVTMLILAIVSTVSSKKMVPIGPVVQEGAFVKDDWIFSRKFLYKRDQELNGQGPVKVRSNRMAKFSTGEVGFWMVERRNPVQAGKKKRRKLPLGSDGYDVFVLNVPKDEEHELLVSYEIPVSKGRYHASAIQFAPEGSIFIRNAKAEMAGKTEAARKKIGTFSVDVKTLPPIVDRMFAA